MFESLLGDWRIATGVKASLLLVADNLEQLCRRWSEVCGTWIHMSLRAYLHGEGGTRGKITAKGVAVALCSSISLRHINKINDLYWPMVTECKDIREKYLHQVR